MVISTYISNNRGHINHMAGWCCCCLLLWVSEGRLCLGNWSKYQFALATIEVIWLDGAVAVPSWSTLVLWNLAISLRSCWCISNLNLFLVAILHFILEEVERERERERKPLYGIWMFFSLQSLTRASFVSLLFSEANFYELSQYASKLQHKKYLLITEDIAYILQCYIEMIPEVEVWQRWVRYRCLLLGEGRTTRKENEGRLGKWRRENNSLKRICIYSS